MARHSLFLRTSREAKYKAKTAIDSFFWRAGDALSAVVVFVGTSLAFDLKSFAKTNSILTLIWLGVAAALVWLRVKESRALREAADTGNDSIAARALSADLFNSAGEPIPPGKDGFVGIPEPGRSEVSLPCSDRDCGEQQWPAEGARKEPGSGPFQPLS